MLFEHIPDGSVRPEIDTIFFVCHASVALNPTPNMEPEKTITWK